MSRESMLIILGVIIAVSPFIGIPFFILSFVLPLIGLGILFIGISFRKKANDELIVETEIKAEPNGPSPI